MSYSQHVSGPGYFQTGAPRQGTLPPFPVPRVLRPIPYSAPQGGPDHLPSQDMAYPLREDFALEYPPYQHGPVTYPPSSVGPVYSSPVQLG